MSMNKLLTKLERLECGDGPPVAALPVLERVRVLADIGRHCGILRRSKVTTNAGCVSRSVLIGNALHKLG